MVFINETGILGTIILAGTKSITGDIFATLFLIMIFLIGLCLLFGIPIEFVTVILLPLCIACATEYSAFVPALGVFIIYLSVIITKHWLFR